MPHISDFRDIDALTPNDFELFAKSVFEAAGWEDLVVTVPGSEFRHGDGGVDIIGKKAGRRFAIEVKKRAVTDRVDIQALNQLVTGGRLNRIDNLILVTNAYFTSEVRVRALRLGVELVDRDQLKSLWEEKRSEIGNRIRPHKHQQAVIDDIKRAFQLGKRRFLIEMATGLGKTYTAAHLIRELRNEVTPGRRPRILFVAHQVEILLQSVTSFKNILGIGDYTYSACFDGAEPENTDLVFGTFDTLVSRLHALPREMFDIIIVDEAHHAAATTYALVVEHFTPVLLMGLTATPFRTDTRDIFRYFGGEEGHIGRFDLFWALKNRKLAFPRYNVFLDDIDQSALRQLQLGVRISDIDKRLFLHKKDEEIAQIINSTANNAVQHPKGIVFCRSIRHLEHFIQFLPAGSATLVHSKLSEQTRRNNIRDFREGDYKFILVCDLFNEGIDIPEANILVFLRFTGSRIIWLQQLGRGLRKTSRKDIVHVLDFVGSLDRLQDIETLRACVEQAPYEPTDEQLVSTDEHHNETLEVHYSHTAAQVLPLVRDLQLRLRSRIEALEALRNYWEKNQTLPAIRAIETALPGISADQLATHFGSFSNYITTALGKNHAQSYAKGICLSYVQEFAQRTGGELPTFKAISQGTEENFLLLCTEDEIAALFNGIDELRTTIETTLPNRARTESTSLTSEKTSLQENQRSLLIHRYINRISTMADLLSLPPAEREEIQTTCMSLFGFLRDLHLEQNRRPSKESAIKS